MTTTGSIPTPARPRRDVVFHAFSEHEWRVCDSHLGTTDLRGLLGFVQQRGDVFEAVRVGQPHIRSFHASLDETRRHFVRPHTFLAPLPWYLPVIDRDAPYDEDDLAPAEPLAS